MFLYSNNEQSKKNLENNSIYNNIKMNKIFKNKLNQQSKRLVHCKLQNIAERKFLKDTNQ